MPMVVAVPLPGVSHATGSDPGLLASRLAPYLAAGVAGGDLGPTVPWRGDGRITPVLGLRLDLWGPLLRLDLGWAPRRGGIGLTLDAHPAWWPLL
jgi:hypothetical protein